MRSDLGHLPDAKQRELAHVVEIVREGFAQAIAHRAASLCPTTSVRMSTITTRRSTITTGPSITTTKQPTSIMTMHRGMPLSS